MFRSLLSKSKKHKSCYGCDRGLSTSEMVEFEAYVSQNRIYPMLIAEDDNFRLRSQCKSKIARGPKDLKVLEEELAEWTKQLSSAKRLIPLQEALDTLLTGDLPAAEATLLAQENRLPELSASVETVRILSDFN